MTARTGTISVQTQDIFPIIKKWLYSEHDIFLRELTSNATDAITKRQVLARSNNWESPTGKVTVEVSKKNKTITISDNGVGMTEVEIEKYLAQLAFSGAEEFVKKMKDQGGETAISRDEIIGKFGLGFYSAFMVSEKVEVDSLSATPGSTAAHWTCAGDPEYTFEPSTRQEVGTTITLHLNKESEDFLDLWKIRTTLKRYCDFMPQPVEISDVDLEEKDRKPEVINETQPLWKKDPSTLTDEDYKTFYSRLFPYDPAPLFWLHLNVDHPFELQGILYFPKYDPHRPVMEQNIKLYSKQVFVSDNVKNIIPEFLGLLKGAIDSPDIPLNVSRSSLQGDPNISKISNYIVRKVAESLKKLAKNDRPKLEQIWPDISLFVKFGATSDTKFDELVRDFIMFKNSEDKLITLDEYLASIPDSKKDIMKDGESQIIATFEQAQGDPNLRKQLLVEGIHCITLDNYIDPHFTQHAEIHEQGGKKLRFSSVAQLAEKLLEEKSDTEETTPIKDLFAKILGEQTDWEVEVKSLKNGSAPAYLKIDESMRRFQQMSRSMGHNAFPMPIKRTLVVNPNHTLVKNAFKISQDQNREALAKKLCWYIQDLATFSSEGFKDNEKETFVLRSQDLMSELSAMALH